MKQISTFFICLVCAASAQAQFGFGPKAGANLARISFSSNNYKNGFIPGFYAGLFVDYRFGAHWAAQFESFYSGEGTKETATSGGGGGHIHPGYVQLPLLAQYHFNMGLYAEAGPQLGLLLSIKETYNGETANIRKYYKSTDFRFPFGIGYEFPASSTVAGLGVDARYSFSFSQINSETVGGGALKNQVISLGVYYKIPVGSGRKK